MWSVNRDTGFPFEITDFNDQLRSLVHQFNNVRIALFDFGLALRIVLKTLYQIVRLVTSLRIGDRVTAQHMQRFAKRFDLSQNHRRLTVFHMAQDIDKERVVCVHLLARPLFNVTQVHRVTFEHVQNIHQRTRSIVTGKHDTGFIVASGRGSFFGEHQKPSHVVRVVFDSVSQHVQIINLSRFNRTNGDHAIIGGQLGQSRRSGGALSSDAFGVRDIFADPLVALDECFGFGVNFFDALQFTIAQQLKRNRRSNLTTDQNLPKVIIERIQRLNDRAASTIFNRHQTKFDVPTSDFFKHTRQRPEVFIIDRVNKMLLGRLMAKGALGTQVTHANATSQIVRRRKNLAVDTKQRRSGNDTVVLSNHFIEFSSIRLVTDYCGITKTNLVDLKLGSFVQTFDQTAVDSINSDAEFLKLGGVG